MSAAAYSPTATASPRGFTRWPATRRAAAVEACAGAGKTWMLVSRILRALLAGAEPQQIVAITFTRKAAGEMRQRFAEWLAEYATADDATRVQARDRGLSAAEAERLAPRLAALQGELLRAGRGVEVRTFHGWFSQLLRAAPLSLLAELGIAPELQLIEDEEELMPQLWRRFHAQVLSDAGPAGRLRISASSVPPQPACLAAGRLCQARGAEAGRWCAGGQPPAARV